MDGSVLEPRNRKLLLVGGVSTPLKNISQLGWLFPIYGKIKNVPNHQPDWVCSWIEEKERGIHDQQGAYTIDLQDLDYQHAWYHDQEGKGSVAWYISCGKTHRGKSPKVSPVSALMGCQCTAENISPAGPKLWLPFYPIYKWQWDVPFPWCQVAEFWMRSASLLRLPYTDLAAK